MPAPEPSDTVPVWSLFVRLSHWLVAALVLFNLFNESGLVHRYAGYAAAAVVLARVLWGLARPRSDPAHVGLPGWRDLQQHLRGLMQGDPPHSLGHNPAGLLMALLLWALVLGLGVTGWLSQLDAYWGEDWPIDLHQYIAQALQACVLLHWAGVLLMSRLQKENLARSMLTGRKPRP